MIRLIAAIDRKRGMAKQGFQPWYIPDDEQYFTDQTKSLGGHVLTGKTTFELAYKNKPLADRQNYILTRDQASIEGAEVIHDLKEFLESFNTRDLWVSGGANVFAQVVEMDKADELYLTHIEADFGCNQFFPEFEDTFELKQKSDLHEQNGFIFSYAVYQRKTT